MWLERDESVYVPVWFFGVRRLLVIVGLFGLGQMAKLRESALVIEQSWMPASRISTTARPSRPVSAWRLCAW